MHYTITIDGEPVPNAKLESVAIEEQLEGRTTKASFDLPIEFSVEDLPGPLAEVVITNSATDDVEFRGYRARVSVVNKSPDLQVWTVECAGIGDYLLKNRLVNETWEGTTDKAIIEEVFGDILPDFNLSHVVEIATGIDVEAKDITLEELLNRLADLSGADWWTTPEPALYYVVPGGIPAAFGFSDNPSNG